MTIISDDHPFAFFQLVKPMMASHVFKLSDYRLFVQHIIKIFHVVIVPLEPSQLSNHLFVRTFSTDNKMMALIMTKLPSLGQVRVNCLHERGETKIGGSEFRHQSSNILSKRQIANNLNKLGKTQIWALPTKKSKVVISAMQVEKCLLLMRRLLIPSIWISLQSLDRKNKYCLQPNLVKMLLPFYYYTQGFFN